MQIQVQKCSTFDEFINVLSEARSIRVVKVEDYGFTAPALEGNVLVIQPQVRLVATAYDKRAMTIYRWEQTTPARDVFTSASDGRVFTQKERIWQLLQLDGFSVEKGEWTPSNIETILGRTGS